MARIRKERAHSEMLRVRVLPEVAELVQKAAEHAAARRGTGTLSDWVREALVHAAQKELARTQGDP